MRAYLFNFQSATTTLENKKPAYAGKTVPDPKVGWRSLRLCTHVVRRGKRSTKELRVSPEVLGRSLAPVAEQRTWDQ